MKRILSVALTVLLLFALTVPAFARGLHFRADGSFRVLLIADPQDDDTPEPDMAALIAASIRKSDPDLIVVLGDLVEDWAVRACADANGEWHDLPYAETLSKCRAAIRQVFAPIIASGVPYTAILGNNDYQSGVSAADWYKLLQAQKGILLPQTVEDPDGRIDNRLSVYGKDGGEALRLFLLDTGTDGVTRTQIAAFEQMNDRRDIPAVVLQHIRVPEYACIWRFCAPWDENVFPLGDFLRVKRSDCLPRAAARVPLWSGAVSRQFASWQRCGNVIGAYFGHLHNISAEGVYGGVRLGAVYSDRWNGTYRHGMMLLTFRAGDVRNYETTIYRCIGSVTTGDAALQPERADNTRSEPLSERVPREWQTFRSYFAHISLQNKTQIRKDDFLWQ